ncbi:hypothetical protein [Shinella sp.]|uniref:hypothetical protein n=1 Tax=Shinella sp. TaxID=1870904 RepID=UPI00289BE226|nr:hypothetical protein [Shinella sp.]
MMRRDRFCDANVRVEQMIWIPGAIAPGVLPENLHDAIVDDLYDGDNAQVIERLPTLEMILKSREEPEDDWIADVLHETDGYLVQLARPIPRDISGTMHSFSWGYYATKWVYAADLDELVDLAESFSNDVLVKARAKESARSAA